MFAQNVTFGTNIESEGIRSYYSDLRISRISLFASCWVASLPGSYFLQGRRETTAEAPPPESARRALLGCCNAPAGTAIAQGLDVHYIVKTGRFLEIIWPPPILRS